MSAQRRSFLFLVAGSPWQSRAQGATDVMLTAAVLDQPVTLCFTGAGVLHLVQHQDGSVLGLKTLVDQYPALGLYGIDHIFAEDTALHAYALDIKSLEIQIEPLSASGIADLIRDSEVVVRCH